MINVVRPRILSASSRKSLIESKSSLRCFSPNTQSNTMTSTLNLLQLGKTNCTKDREFLIFHPNSRFDLLLKTDLLALSVAHLLHPWGQLENVMIILNRDLGTYMTCCWKTSYAQFLTYGNILCTFSRLIYVVLTVDDRVTFVIVESKMSSGSRFTCKIFSHLDRFSLPVLS